MSDKFVFLSTNEDIFDSNFNLECKENMNNLILRVIFQKTLKHILKIYSYNIRKVIFM